jgi:hypothetical protein
MEAWRMLYRSETWPTCYCCGHKRPRTLEASDYPAIGLQYQSVWLFSLSSTLRNCKSINNFDSFEINDRKGLEIVILAVLLTFADANEAAHPADGNAGQSNVLSRNTSAKPSKPDAPPPPPPKPAPKTGVERIAEMQAVQGEYNEIIISDEGSVADYAAFCHKLLQVCQDNRTKKNSLTFVSGRCNTLRFSEVGSGRASC